MPSGQRETTVSVPLTPTRSDLYWRRIFEKYDKDKDGKISYVELKGIIESREYDHDLPDNVVDKIMALADRDNSGYLDFREFVEMMQHPDLKAVFGHFVARYIHSIIPHRSPVDTTGTWPGFRAVSTSDGDALSAKREGRGQKGSTGSRTPSRETARRLAAGSSEVVASRPGLGPITRRGPASVASPDTLVGRNGIVPTRSKGLFTYTDGTYEEEYSCWPPAVCMILFSLLEIVLFCYDAAQGKPDTTGPMAVIFIYNPNKRHEAWRFLTYMLVHVNVVHLLVNLLVQLFLGVPLEMVHKWWRVTLVYLAGVAAGSLATSLTDPRVYLAGASGGVYALIAAHIATIIMNWAEMEFAIIQLLVFLLLAAVDVGTAVYYRYFRQMQQNIGYVAHFAGAVAGLLVGIGVLRNLEKRKWEKRLWWAAVVLYCALMIAGILANIFWTSHFL